MSNDFIALAEHYRAQHEATHGEAEMCGGECIVLGLTDESITLICAVCLYNEGGGKAKTALTVIEGYAVCDDHLGYVAQGQKFASIIRTLAGTE